MSMQVGISSINSVGQCIYVTFNLTVITAGGYTTAVGGDVLNFTSGSPNPAIQDPAFIGMAAAIESSQLLNIDVWSQGGNLTRQYVPNKVGVSPATGAKVKIGGASFASELGTGAYPSDVTSDILTGMAVFTKMV